MFRLDLLYVCIAVVCSQHVHDRQFLGPRSKPSSSPPYSSSADVPSTPEYRPSSDQEYRPPGTPEYRPPSTPEYRVPIAPEYRPQANGYEDRPNDYQPNYAYGYEPEQCIPRDGPSEYVPKDYVKRDAQDYGQPIYGSPPHYEDDNGPTRPSVSEESGYIPEDIMG